MSTGFHEPDDHASSEAFALGALDAASDFDEAMAALTPDAPVGALTDEHVAAIEAFAKRRRERYAAALKVVDAARIVTPGGTICTRRGCLYGADMEMLAHYVQAFDALEHE